jgi:hypothetical protein
MKFITYLIRAILCFIGITSLILTMVLMGILMLISLALDILFGIRILHKS